MAWLQLTIDLRGADPAPLEAALEEAGAQAITLSDTADQPLLEPGVGETPREVVEGFRRHLFATRLFFDPFAGGKFGNYLLGAHETNGRVTGSDDAHRQIEEAQLFIEAAHACHGRMSEQAAAV